MYKFDVCAIYIFLLLFLKNIVWAVQVNLRCIIFQRNLGIYDIYMIEAFRKIVNSFLPIFTKSSIIDIYVSAFAWCTDTFLLNKYYNLRQKMEISYVSIIGLIISAAFKLTADRYRSSRPEVFGMSVLL